MREKRSTISETPSAKGQEGLDSNWSLKCYHIRVSQSCGIQPFEERSIWGKLEGQDTKNITDAYVKGTGQLHQRTDLLTALVRISFEIMKEEIRIPVCPQCHR